MINIYDAGIECLQEIQISLIKDIQKGGYKAMTSQYEFNTLQSAIEIIKNYKK